MIWSLRTIFLLVLIATSTIALGGIQKTQAATDALGCEIIDLNWKEYGENIRGANTKVSDVVLNACEAIGGRSQCTFLSGCRYNEGDANQNNPICTPNTGASNSQHRHSKAIDLKVTKGKEKEFMTLAICGLRRVNGCEGGLGFYSGGSIHVDVRQGVRSVWSDNFKRSGISTSVRDVAARSILYGFGDGNCTTGSIASDNTEEKEYGPIEEYTPPKGYTDEFKAIIQPYEYKPKGYLEAVYQTAPNIPSVSFPNLFQSIGGGGISDPTKQVFSDDLIYIDSGTGSDSSGGSETNNNTLLDFTDGSKNQTSDDSGNILTFDTQANNSSQNNEVSCEGSGFLGTNFFKTCDTPKETVSSDVAAESNGSIVSTLMHNITKLTKSDGVNENVQVKNLDTPSAIQKGIVSDNSFDGFYATHIPNDSEAVTQQSPSVQIDNSNYGQFVIGGQQAVTPERVSDTSGKAVRFAEQSVLYGTYYGVTHMVSPLLIGSAPRSLLRMTDGNDFTRVHNLFSI